MSSLKLTTFSILSHVMLAQAQHPGGSASGNPYSGGGSSGGSSSSSGGGGGFPSSSEAAFLGFNANTAETYRLAHGVLASLAFVIFFPAGAISMRVIPGRLATWIHAAFQMLAYALYICAFGLGIWMVTKIKFTGFNFLTLSSVRYHPLIGIVIFCFLFFQPILGLIHHSKYKQHQRRQVWSYAHLWLGRILITLGIINGGLGLKIADNTRGGEIAYGVVAGIIWLVWMAVAVVSEIKRGRNASSPGKGRHGSESPVRNDEVARDVVDTPAHAPSNRKDEAQYA